jgi:transketolase
MIGIDSFGASASVEEVMKGFRFTAERVSAAALRLLSHEEEAVHEEANHHHEQGENALPHTSSAEGHS